MQKDKAPMHLFYKSIYLKKEKIIMEFNIEASATSNKKLIETYPCLNNFCYTEKEIKRPRIELIKDENGEKMWQNFGYWNDIIPQIQINSFEDIMKLIQEVGAPLIIDNDSIEIYDGWRE